MDIIKKSNPVHILGLIGHLPPQSKVWIKRKSVVVHNKKFYIRKSDTFYTYMGRTYCVALEVGDDQSMYIEDPTWKPKDKVVYHHMFLTPKPSLFFGPFEFSSEPIDFCENYENEVVWESYKVKINESIEQQDMDRVHVYENDLLKMLDSVFNDKDVNWLYDEYLNFHRIDKLEDRLIFLIKEKLSDFIASTRYSHLVSLFVSFLRNKNDDLWFQAIDLVTEDQFRVFIQEFGSISTLKEHDANYQEIITFLDDECHIEQGLDEQEINVLFKQKELYLGKLKPLIDRRIKELEQNKYSSGLSNIHIDELQMKLTQVLADNDYEQAAEIRDEIESRKVE